MKIIKTISFIAISLLMLACNNEKTLQKYYVENQEDSKFISLDIPTSLFAKADNLDEDQRATLESVRKINVLAYPLNEENETFDAEKAELEKILSNDEYQLLMKYGSNERKGALYFTGEEDAIDEIVAFGYDNERGMGVARILGKDMNPQKIMELVKSLDADDINVEGLKGFADMMVGDSKNIKVTTDSTKVKSGISVDVEVDTVSTAN
ncbi:DUF4252 domain-containing protein [Zunongwangia sp. SCSIO 43204]|uniref:DUF4252 domain-containing protein n=1 Tax=Zunongwangia sp. SCSIO 43204 TaxID=2779359 RepID=UPI001CA8A66D|nr:DUF4252 domain-containing protein [Zunongwangia sp. SCSIO 43204]UAB83592.1 DUF4252 domain-containing protein [Zunongwangia sp. SCSIO 43204]